MAFNANLVYLIFLLILNTGCVKKNTVSMSVLITSKGITYFNQQPFSGIGSDSYGNNQKQLEINYRDGKKHGEIYSWYPSGQIKEEGVYKKGKKIGIHLGFWANGNLRFKKNFNLGLLGGEQNQWHKNGILARLSNYSEGKEQGQKKGWRNNGDLRYNYQMINNRRYGFMGSKTCVPVEM